MLGLSQNNFINAANNFLERKGHTYRLNVQGNCSGLSVYRVKCRYDAMHSGRPDKFWLMYKRVLRKNSVGTEEDEQEIKRFIDNVKNLQETSELITSEGENIEQENLTKLIGANQISEQKIQREQAKSKGKSSLAKRAGKAKAGIWFSQKGKFFAVTALGLIGGFLATGTALASPVILAGAGVIAASAIVIGGAGVLAQSALNKAKEKRGRHLTQLEETTSDLQETCYTLGKQFQYIERQAQYILATKTEQSQIADVQVQHSRKPLDVSTLSQQEYVKVDIAEADKIVDFKSPQQVAKICNNLPGAGAEKESSVTQLMNAQNDLQYTKLEFRPKIC